MPELPEVETVCRVLSKNIIGLTIKKAKIINKNLRYTLSFSIEKKILQSKRRFWRWFKDAKTNRNVRNLV